MAGTEAAGYPRTCAVAEALGQIGVEALVVGEVSSAERLAAVVAETRADSIELFLGRGGGVLLLRHLLRELIARGRRDVSIVIHKL